MGKYIPLDALLAEIKRLKGKVDDRDAYSNGWQHALRTAEIDIDSLEVKEVDFVKEYKDFLKCDDGRSMFETAKYFFELGLKAQKVE